MSAANQVEISIAPEASFGTPAASAARTRLRYNSETLASTVNDEDSVEITQERNITDVIPLSATHGGDITTSLSFANLDTLIESCLYSSFVDADGTNDASAVGISTAGAITGTNLPDSQVGDWLYLTKGSANNAVGGWFLVTKLGSGGTANKPANVWPVPAAAITGASIEKENAHIRNGKTRKGITIQKFFASLNATDSGGKDFHYYEGAVVNTMTMEFRAGASVGATVGVSALRHTVAAETKLNTSETDASTGLIYSPADTKQVGVFDINSTSGAATSLLGGATEATAPIITAVTLSINNNIREGEELGTLDVPDLISGNFGCEGTVEMYFRDSDLYDRFLSRGEQSLAWIVREPNDEKNGYGFFMPRVRMRNARVQAGGNDSDLIAQFDYRALGDKAANYTLAVSRGA